MKKLVFLLVVIFSIASCGKEEIFSCDPNADMWVKSNLTEIRDMTRADWNAVGDLVYMRAAYNAFTPAQRQALWVGKLEEALKLDWTEQESQHIQSMLELIKDNLFFFSNERNQEDFDKVDVELYRWTDYAQENLGWDKKLVGALIATPQVMNAKKEVVTDFGVSLKNRSETQTQCSCSSAQDFCTSGFKCNVTLCVDTTTGCGFLWVLPCRGECQK